MKWLPWDLDIKYWNSFVRQITRMSGDHIFPQRQITNSVKEIWLEAFSHFKIITHRVHYKLSIKQTYSTKTCVYFWKSSHINQLKSHREENLWTLKLCTQIKDQFNLKRSRTSYQMFLSFAIWLLTSKYSGFIYYILNTLCIYKSTIISHISYTILKHKSCTHNAHTL